MTLHIFTADDRLEVTANAARYQERLNLGARTRTDHGQPVRAVQLRQQFDQRRVERRRGHTLLKEPFLRRIERPQRFPLVRRFGFAGDVAQHHPVVDADAIVAVILPREGHVERREHLRPARPVHRFRIKKYTVKIEENGLRFGHEWGNFSVACGIKEVEDHAY